MRRKRRAPAPFLWTDWNRDKVLSHGLTPEEVEFAWERRLSESGGRRANKFMTFGRTPSGRLIQIVWRFTMEFDALEPGQLRKVIFVITAF